MLYHVSMTLLQLPVQRGAPGPNSSYGVPNWVAIITIIFIGYVILRVHLSLKKERGKK